MIRVAIDGPSGAGKSTVAKRIAKDLSIIYVDTGAMYRCIGLYALRQGLDTKDSQQVSSCLEQIHLETSYDVQNGQRIFLNGEDVSEAIRTPDASMAASNVSAIPQVRAFLLDLQRDMAKKQSLVMCRRESWRAACQSSPAALTPVPPACRLFLPYFSCGCGSAR